ncbi:MAG: D-tyrosyl-tRNA(Tyr) deacylase [Clostridia bacterium]|nr:D-tyrosyl-tRNA(Tyr) deacylase [Clostridia bacterium]
MKAVIQRVLEANLKVDGELISEIGQGYVIFLGVAKGDTTEDADYFIKKIPPLRICEDENGKINKSIVDVGGEILLVSQFTLYANTSHGNRPDFLAAEVPDKANELYQYVAVGLKKQGLTVKLGVFGADMKISQINDGPFTVVLEKPDKK